MRRIGLAMALMAAAAGTAAAQVPERVPFAGSARATIAGGFLVVESDGIPNHATGPFPGPGNPNSIQRQSYRFFLPLRPRQAAQPAALPMGPIGVALNGVPFYNPYNAERRDAVSGPFAEQFDACQGHPDPQGRYHYHQFPTCLAAGPAGRDGHSGVIGYAFDGYAIHGPNGAGGRPPADLDRCNGHSDAVRGYHYHASARFPYLLGCYRGEVDARNLDRGRPGGPPGRPAGPAHGPGHGPPPR